MTITLERDLTKKARDRIWTYATRAEIRPPLDVFKEISDELLETGEDSLEWRNQDRRVKIIKVTGSRMEVIYEDGILHIPAVKVTLERIAQRTYTNVLSWHEECPSSGFVQTYDANRTHQYDEDSLTRKAWQWLETVCAHSYASLRDRGNVKVRCNFIKESHMPLLLAGGGLEIRFEASKLDVEVELGLRTGKFIEIWNWGVSDMRNALKKGQFDFWNPKLTPEEALAKARKIRKILLPKVLKPPHADKIGFAYPSWPLWAREDASWSVTWGSYMYGYPAIGGLSIEFDEDFGLFHFGISYPEELLPEPEILVSRGQAVSIAREKVRFLAKRYKRWVSPRDADLPVITFLAYIMPDTSVFERQDPDAMAAFEDSKNDYSFAWIIFFIGNPQRDIPIGVAIDARTGQAVNAIF